MAEELTVRLHDRPVGVVRRAARAGDIAMVRLQLASTDSTGVRLTESFAALPGSDPDPGLVSSFFGGYTPEGNQRRALAAKHGIDPTDLFALLRQFGGSIAGALSLAPPDEPPETRPSYDPLRPADLGRLLRQAVDEHDLALRDDSRSMIQGFQPKVLLARFTSDGPWMQPHGRAHSTHIVKPELSTRASAIHDEFASHCLAREMGLASFDSHIGAVGRTRYLAIERFDRRVEGERVHLVHQEDAAQALGLDWVDDEAKFQDPRRPNSPNRPTAERIATLAASLDEDAIETWIRQLTFRVLVGDNDGHAKNVGVLHLPGRDTLADLYDAVPNLYQAGRITWDMALAVDGEFDHRRMSVDRILSEVESWAVTSSRRARSIIDGVVSDFGDALEAVSIPAGVTPGMEAGLRWNVDQLAAGKEISEPKRRR